MTKLGDMELISDPTLSWNAEAVDAGQYADYIIRKRFNYA